MLVLALLLPRLLLRGAETSWFVWATVAAAAAGWVAWGKGEGGRCGGCRCNDLSCAACGAGTLATSEIAVGITALCQFTQAGILGVRSNRAPANGTPEFNACAAVRSSGLLVDLYRGIYGRCHLQMYPCCRMAPATT